MKRFVQFSIWLMIATALGGSAIAQTPVTLRPVEGLSTQERLVVFEGFMRQG